MRTYIENKNERSKSINLLKAVTLATLTGALAVAPLLTVSAQAAPPDHAPAYGYRNKDNKAKKNKNKNVIRDRDRDGYDDRDDDRDGDIDEDDGYDYRETPRYERRYGDNDNRWNTGQTRTIRGTVTRRISNTRFEIRSGSTVYTVNSRNNLSTTPNQGDRVEVTGRLTRNNVLRANAVRILTNNGGRNGRAVNFPATVISVSNGRQLTVRGDNGRNYVVRIAGNISSNIDRGDRVRIIGRVSNSMVMATQIQLLDDRNDDDDNDWDNGDRVDFRGVVTNISGWGSIRILTVRADNGRTYSVRTGDDDWDRGDRVRVRGTLGTGNVIQAADVDRA